MELEKLHIAQTDETPEVFLTVGAEMCFITGRSLPENAFDFYDPILKWIKTYVSQSNKPFLLQLRFEYFNSSSGRYLFELLNLLEQSKYKGNYRVICVTDKDDELMIDKGEELRSLCDLKFEMVVSSH